MIFIKCYVEMILKAADSVEENENEWVARFENNRRVVFNRYTYVDIAAGEMRISKKAKRTYGGKVYEVM